MYLGVRYKIKTYLGERERELEREKLLGERES